MKVGTRKQQGQTGEGKTGQNPREVCPACQTHYLKTFFSSEVTDSKRTFVKKGKFCPNELCTFCRKDKEE